MITLTRDALPLTQRNTVAASQHSWPLRIVASRTTPDAPLSPAVFVFHAVRGTTTDASDIFEAVASIHQISEIPEDRPAYDPSDASRCIPYYRLANLTFQCRSPEEADTLWESIQEDVNDLVANFLALQDLKTTATVVITGTL